MLTPDNVRLLFSYDDIEGGLYWLPRSGPRNWNSRFAGTRVGCVNRYGYRQLLYRKRSYHEHRVVWLWHHGVWPSDLIDHINRVRLDNRIENLRDVPPSVNRRNTDARYVYQTPSGSWSLSYTFDTEDEARAALAKIARPDTLTSSTKLDKALGRISSTKQREHEKFNAIGRASA